MNSNGRITAPVSLHADVFPVLGLTKTGTFYDIGHVNGNTHGRINRWAMYKPERTGGVGELTLAQRQANKFGLVPQLNTKALESMSGYAGNSYPVGSTGHTIDQIIEANAEWAYNAPRPGTDWCRMTDFEGYYHKAESPLDGWRDWDIYLSDLEMYTASRGTYVLADDGDPGSWVMQDIFGTYPYMKARITENSATYINGGNSDMIPLSYLLGGVTTERWRPGVAVYVEGQNYLQMFTSCYPLDMLLTGTDVMTTGRALPALSTNQQLCHYMMTKLGKNSYVDFRAFPVLVRDCTIGLSLAGGQFTSIYMNGAATQLYSAPTGATSFNIRLHNNNNPSVPGLLNYGSSVTADGDYMICAYGTGTNTGSGISSRPIVGIAIVKVNQNTAISGTVRITYNITYSYGTDTRTEDTISGTATLTSASNFTCNGTTYKGTTLISRPAVTITDFDRLVKA